MAPSSVANHLRTVREDACSACSCAPDEGRLASKRGGAMSVLVSDADFVRTVRIGRPEKKNALTLAMYTALADALEEADRRDEIRCVIIAGHASGFCAGNDLNDFVVMAQTGGAGAPILGVFPGPPRGEAPPRAA